MDQSNNRISYLEDSNDFKNKVHQDTLQTREWKTDLTKPLDYAKTTNLRIIEIYEKSEENTNGMKTHLPKL